MHTLRRVLAYEYLTVNKRLPPRQYICKDRTLTTLKHERNQMQHSRAVWTAVGIRMFSSCRRQNEGDERLALKRHLMVNMTNLRAKAKPVEREMSYSHMVAEGLGPNAGK